MLIIDNDNRSLHSFLVCSAKSSSGCTDKRGKKERFVVFHKTAQQKMLPELYLTPLESQLSASQLLTLEMLVWLLQFHKQIRIERLAACLPLPILYESRRRHVQRFLILPQLSIPMLMVSCD